MLGCIPFSGPLQSDSGQSLAFAMNKNIWDFYWVSAITSGVILKQWKNVMFLSEWSYCAFSEKSSKRFVINFQSLQQSLFWQYFKLKNLSRCFVSVLYPWHWTHFIIPVDLMGLDNFKKESQITNEEKYLSAIVKGHILKKSNFKYLQIHKISKFTINLFVF